MISDSEGAELVRLARRAVEMYLRDLMVIKPEKDDSAKAGVFVTLNYQTRNREEHLRGCIGFPLPEKMLRQSVVEAAIAAATEDPRFPPVDRQELDSMIFEVSVLTPPEEIKASPADYGQEIKIGRDGLLFRWRYGSGLLLPQVPVELKWDVDEYLANICYKAGAPADAWLDPSCKLYRFHAIVFKEKDPRGTVTRLEL
jgi:uncharacterized protein